MLSYLLEIIQNSIKKTFNCFCWYLVEQGVFVGARGEDQARENGARRNDQGKESPRKKM